MSKSLVLCNFKENLTQQISSTSTIIKPECLLCYQYKRNKGQSYKDSNKSCNKSDIFFKHICVLQVSQSFQEAADQRPISVLCSVLKQQRSDRTEEDSYRDSNSSGARSWEQGNKMRKWEKMKTCVERESWEGGGAVHPNINWYR